MLGVLASLAWLSAALVLESRRQIAEQTAFTRRGKLRAAAWSAAEAAVAVLRERQLVDGGLHAVPDDLMPAMLAGGFTPPWGVAVTVRAEDLSGRYGLRAIDSDTLRELLIDLGLKFDDAGRLADALLRAAHPARDETDDASPQGPDHPAEDALDLAAAPGFSEFFKKPDGTPNERFGELTRCLSITGDTATPNLNSAPAPLLRHLARRGVIGDAAALDRWLAGPDGRRGTGDDRYARTAADLVAAGCGPVDSGAVLEVTRVRITVSATLGEGTFTISLLADPTAEGRAFPWKILRSEENRRPD